MADKTKNARCSDTPNLQDVKMATYADEEIKDDIEQSVIQKSSERTEQVLSSMDKISRTTDYVSNTFGIQHSATPSPEYQVEFRKAGKVSAGSKSSENAKSMQRISQSLCLKKSEEELRREASMTTAGISEQNMLLKWMKLLFPFGIPNIQFEEEAISTCYENIPPYYSERSAQYGTQGGVTTRRSIFTWSKDKISSVIIRNVSAAPEPKVADQEGTSRVVSTANQTAVKPKRSRFGGLINLPRPRSDSQISSHQELDASSETGEFEKSRSDTATKSSFHDEMNYPSTSEVLPASETQLNVEIRSAADSADEKARLSEDHGTTEIEH